MPATPPPVLAVASSEYPAGAINAGFPLGAGSQARVTFPALMHEVQMRSRRGVRPTTTRMVWMFGFQRRRVRRCECEILLPKPGRLPQTSQTEATGSLHWVIASWVTVRSGPERLVKDIRPPGLDANRVRTPRSSVPGSSLRGMAAEVLDEETVRCWCRLGVDALAQTRAAIDALNVFPVPDADTGTNLHLTLVSAAEAAQAVPSGAGPAEIWPAVA